VHAATSGPERPRSVAAPELAVPEAPEAPEDVAEVAEVLVVLGPPGPFAPDGEEAVPPGELDIADDEQPASASASAASTVT
jgi:hypothetical protein